METQEERLYEALRTLNGDQLYVLAAVMHGLTEREIAQEFALSRGESFSRDRVHRIRLTAIAKLRRGIEKLGAA